MRTKTDNEETQTIILPTKANYLGSALIVESKPSATMTKTTDGTDKTCATCHKIKPLTEYYKRLNGHQRRCKHCQNFANAAYQRIKRKEWKEASTLARSKKLD